ncbi:MAG: hypothetical protein ACJAUP_002927 [Cellvibrionaceae bacterium]|jgi:hypothetical protein
MDKEIDLFTFLVKVLENNSIISLLLTVVSMCVWIIGGNIVDKKCARRLGLSTDELPTFSFKHYNKQEKICLLGLFSLAFILGAIGLFSN